eukprot:Em0007g1390a
MVTCPPARRVVNLLVSGKVPQEVSLFMAGGSLTALSKLKPGCAPDIRPIAVGEVLRRLTGKCLCAVLKQRVIDFFEPIQFGVACPMGSEKVIHGIRACVEKFWNDRDFSVMKVDFKNAFNLVSRDAVLQECANHFPDLLPWVAWCYGSHPFLWHTMGQLTSQSGDTPTFPSELKVSNLPHFEILGCPIGDYIYCANFIASKRLQARKLLLQLKDVAATDPQVALTLLRLCGSFCSPSTSQGLHLDPIEFRVAVKWWLGLDTSQGSQCAFCPAHSLDPLGHHALTCKCGGDAVLRHNALRDTLVHFLHRAHASVQVEVGAGLFPDHSQSRPADILLQNWNLGRPVALDISVVSPLNPSTLAEAGATFGAVLEATESRKHQANDEKCSALGWVSTPLAVDSYGAWGKEATLFLAQVAARLAIHKSLPKSQASFDLFSNLSICLIRANARAILRRV